MKFVIAVCAVLALAFGLTACGGGSTVHKTAPPVRPLSNNCSGGSVAFSFDDGPSTYTQATIDKLRALHVPAVFFVIGERVAANPQVVREEVADGFIVGNHTWDHQSFTGASTDTPPLTDAQVTAELSRAAQAIVAAGAPRPTLWRAPDGDLTPHQNAIAHSLGLRLVMSYGTGPSNVIDSQDWTGIPAATMVYNMTHGYADSHTVGGQFIPGMRNGSILAFHDGIAETPNTIAALQGIVGYMNSHHLCATTTVPANAAGGMVPNN